jgi:hypothetical protein
MLVPHCRRDLLVCTTAGRCRVDPNQAVPAAHSFGLGMLRERFVTRMHASTVDTLPGEVRKREVVTMYRDRELGANPGHQPAAPGREHASKGSNDFSPNATLASYEVEEIEVSRLGQWLMLHASQPHPSIPVPKLRSPPRRRWNDALSLQFTMHAYEIEEIAGGRLGVWLLQNLTEQSEKTPLLGNVHRVR